MVFDYGFHKFTENGCETNWTIVANLVSSTFLVNRYHLSIFQSWGKIPELNDFLNTIDNGMTINSLTDFIIGISQPSGPGFLLLCKLIILL